MKITVYGHEVEIVYVRVTPSGHGHMLLSFNIRKNDLENLLEYTTNNMPDFDDAMELEGDEQKLALFNIVKNNISINIDEWVMAMEQEEQD